MEEEWQRERAMDDSEQVLLKPADIKDVLDNYVIINSLPSVSFRGSA